MGRLDATDVTVRIEGKLLLQTDALQFAAGAVTAIVGPNGAGKSTLMSVLTGQRTPTTGCVRLEGNNLFAWPSAELARIRASVAQQTEVAFNFTAREVVELGRYPHHRQPHAIEAAIAQQAMQTTATQHLGHRTYESLSGGEKARIQLARALAQVWAPITFKSGATPARWLLLDEPTSALDLQFQHRMLRLAAEWAHQHGLGVVAVLHDLNLALRYADRCVLLDAGRLVATGPTAEVLTPACIDQVWGVHASAVQASSVSAKPLRHASVQYVFELAD